MSSKIWIVARREYLSRVQKKSFILVTLLTPTGYRCVFGTDWIYHECRQYKVTSGW